MRTLGLDLHRTQYLGALLCTDEWSTDTSAIRRDPGSGLWNATPIYDVLHTWPYEGDHRFYPAIRDDGPHDTVTLKHWLAFATDMSLPARAAGQIIERVRAALPTLEAAAMTEVDLPQNRLRDLRRVLRRRAADLKGA